MIYYNTTYTMLTNNVASYYMVNIILLYNIMMYVYMYCELFTFM